MFKVTLAYASFQKVYEFENWNDTIRYAASTNGRIVAFQYIEKQSSYEDELENIII